LKTMFLYRGPHPVHEAWAESVRAIPFHYRVVNNRLLEKFDSYSVYFRWFRKKISRFFFKHCPIDNNLEVILSEGGDCLPEATILKRRLNSKIVLIAGDPTFFNLKMTKQIKEYFDNLHGIIAVSEMVKADIEKLFGKRFPIEVVHPFIFHEKFSRLKPDLESNNLVFTAAHLPIKGIELLPKIFTMVKKEVSNVRLFVLGRESKYTWWLKSFSSGGFQVIGFTKIEPYLQKSSILVHPALYDTFSIAVIEAMASGVIPIVTEKTGAKEAVKNVSERLVVKPDPKLIADRIIEVLSLPHEEKLKLSSLCRKEALKTKYTKEYSVSRFMAAFNRLVGGK